MIVTSFPVFPKSTHSIINIDSYSRKAKILRQTLRIFYIITIKYQIDLNRVKQGLYYQREGPTNHHKLYFLKYSATYIFFFYFILMED